MQNIKNIIKSPILLVLLALIVGVLMIVSAYVYNEFIKTDKDLEIFQATPPVDEACILEFSIGHDTSAPQVACSKLVNGQESTQNSPTLVGVGDKVIYTLNVTNTSTTQDYTLNELSDVFANGHGDTIYIDMSSAGGNDPVDPGNTNLNCIVTGSVTDTTDPQTVWCPGGNKVIAPGETVTIMVEAIAAASTDNVISNTLSAIVKNPANDQQTTVTCPAYIQVVPQVYSLLSCTKTLTPSSTTPGGAVSSVITANLRTVNDLSEKQDNEIVISSSQGLALSLSDPLYNVASLGNSNVNWIENPQLPDSAGACSVSSSSEVICNYPSLIITNNKKLLEFTGNIASVATAGASIVNVAELTVGNEKVTCSDTLQITETPEEALSCTKKFLDGNGVVISSNEKILPGDKFTASIVVTNTGNTDLSAIKIEDPLNTTLASLGAKNLSSVKFVEIASSSDTQAKAKCALSNDLKTLNCADIALAKSASITVNVVLEARASMTENVEVVNVAQVSVVDNSDVGASCTASINTGEVEDPDPATHLECRNKACVEVSGAGSNECLEDYQCKYTTCENDACVTKACDDGSCKSDCLDDDHCREDRKTHLACRNQSCVVVDGEGANQCDTNSDCSVLTSTNRPVTQVPDTGALEKTLVVTVVASALMFLGLILATL